MPILLRVFIAIELLLLLIKHAVEQKKVFPNGSWVIYLASRQNSYDKNQFAVVSPAV